MKRIPLTQGKYALVDDADFEYLNQWKWHYSIGYAVRRVTPKKGEAGKIKTILMHREVLRVSDTSQQVDHINNNRRDNQRSNLRLCSLAENRRNKGMSKNNKTGYKGVNKTGNKWTAKIWLNRKQIHLGTYNDIMEAAKAYNNGALKHHGEFANLNEIPDA